MTGDAWGDDARGIWQSQESAVTRMSMEEMRARARRWNREFEGTNWIAFACAAVLLLFFVPMLLISETTLQRAGAAIGIVSAAYVVGVGLRIASRRRWVDDSATCVRAYKAQLERRRQADMGAARTILLMMTGCALLGSPGDVGSWALRAVGQLGAGIVVYVYISRQARRFQQRIAELDRLDGD
ncbi:hypothetical protein LuPra_00637 [Luteitalea pratensis]|uniref:Uncharacterized protein n=1 Tax=Luteitalea pratensis TaxID=1855912 RepID=A0A143PI70_LUTPR|nr:hypothetical protein [Luteitalea pratensis]AMY07464.1 hypothetical protein LuPra_00637 [Luteitalea pratensis]